MANVGGALPGAIACHQVQTKSMVEALRFLQPARLIMTARSSSNRP
ncbi:MAG: hypothetical protein AAFX78_03290 [Cyanobacteria bacterium J06638_20]